MSWELAIIKGRNEINMLVLKGKHSELWKVIRLEGDGLFLKDLGKAHAAQIKLQIRDNFCCMLLLIAWTGCCLQWIKEANLY